MGYARSPYLTLALFLKRPTRGGSHGINSWSEVASFAQCAQSKYEMLLNARAPFLGKLVSKEVGIEPLS